MLLLPPCWQRVSRAPMHCRGRCGTPPCHNATSHSASATPLAAYVDQCPPRTTTRTRMLRSASQHVAAPLLRWAAASASGAQSQLFGTAAAASSAACSTQRSGGDVPAGHLSSDLTPTACNIGLGRRRDLTLRQDLCLWEDGEKKTIADVFRVRSCGRLAGATLGPHCAWLGSGQRVRLPPPPTRLVLEGRGCHDVGPTGTGAGHTTTGWLCAPHGLLHACCLAPRPTRLGHAASHHMTVPVYLHLQGQKTILVGFPGGKICTETHIPGYVQMVRGRHTRRRQAEAEAGQGGPGPAVLPAGREGRVHLESAVACKAWLMGTGWTGAAWWEGGHGGVTRWCTLSATGYACK